MDVWLGILVRTVADGIFAKTLGIQTALLTRERQ